MKIVIAFLAFTFFSMTSVAEDSTLHEYKGVYKFPDGSATPEVEISIVEGNLYASATIGSAVLTKVSKDTFSIPDHNGMAYFYRNGDGQIKGIKVEVGGLILEGDKNSHSLVLYSRKRTYIVK